MNGRAVLAVVVAALTLDGPARVVGSGVRGTPSAQDTFRTRADLVSLYATVTDASGRLVQNLAKDDFEIRDNGKPQALTFFSNDLQPITIVVMLDRSGSMEDNFPLVQHAAEQFVSRLLPDDRARIGNFSREIVIQPSGFTSDPDLLRQVLRHGLQGIGPSPVWTAVDRSITALLKEPGRRVVLLFSDGHNDPRRGQVFVELNDVIRRSEYDEIMVYAIGLAEVERFAFSFARPTVFGRVNGSSRARVIKPDPGLRKLADRSGGGYFELSWQQDLDAVFARIADELHRQYAFGFPPKKLDGEVHKLDVRVKRPGLTVRARRTYVAESR